MANGTCRKEGAFLACAVRHNPFALLLSEIRVARDEVASDYHAGIGVDNARKGVLRSLPFTVRC
jgi:hypothetical protein